MLKCKLYSILIAVCLAAMPSIASTNDDLSLGEAEYNQADYQKAVTHFDKTIEQQPTNAIAYYYRANTLYKLGLSTKALLDYQQAYKLSTSPIMRGYCQSAITALMSNTGVSALDKNSAINRNTQPACDNNQEQAIQSLRTIQLQTALDKVRIVDTGELEAQDHTLKEQIRLSRMRQETERDLQGMQNAFYYDQFGRRRPMYSPEEIQGYSRMRQEQENALMRSIQKASQIQTQSSEQRAQLTQEAAANLANQLSGNSQPDGVKLDPLGTNLYVRNYDVVSPSQTQTIPKPAVGLLASEKKLAVPKTSGTASSKDTEIKTETVHGKLLN